MKLIRYKLDEILNELNLSSYKVAKQTKIDINAIKKIRGNIGRQVRFDTLEILMKYLDCDLYDLIEVIEISDKEYEEKYSK